MTDLPSVKCRLPSRRKIRTKIKSRKKSKTKIKRKSRIQAGALPLSYSRVEFLLINPMSIRTIL